MPIMVNIANCLQAFSPIELLTGSAEEAQVDLSEDDESVIILTSGTTGTSKPPCARRT